MSTGKKRRFFWRVILPVLLVVLTLTFGTFGFHQCFHDAACAPSDVEGGQAGWDEAFLSSAGLLSLETTFSLEAATDKPVLLDIARWLGLLFPPYAALLIIVTALRERLKPAHVSWWRLLRRKYAVVCGCGWKGAELVRNLRDGSEEEGPWRVVVIDKDPHNAIISDLAGSDVITMVGDAASPEILLRAQALRADRLYVVCNSDELNSRVASQLCALKRGEDIPPCFVHVDDPRTRYLLADKLGTGVRCFSTYDTTARLLLELHPIDRGQECQDLQVVILGSHPMALALLLQILRIAHFGDGVRCHITWAMPDMEQTRRELLREHPYLDFKGETAFSHDAAAVRVRDEVFPEVEFVELPQGESDLLADDSAIFSTIAPGRFVDLYVCLDDGLASMALVSTVRDKLRLAQQKATGSRVQLHHYYNFPRDDYNPLIDKLKASEAGFTIDSFGKFLEVCSVDVVEGADLDRLAKEIAAFYDLLYGSNKRRQQALSSGEPRARQAAVEEVWTEAEEWKRESNRQAADHVAVKLRSIGFTVDPRTGASVFPSAELVEALEDKDVSGMLCRMEHNRWCAERLIEGWLPVRDISFDDWKRDRKDLQKQKLHFDLAPYDDLEPSEQEKDLTGIHGIPMALAKAGRPVRRG